MPSLNASGPELRALEAIQRLVVPLLEKQIVEGIENAESLAVQNSLDLLRFEMSSLLFWITKGQELNNREHETFLQDLQPVLELLENSINHQIVDWRTSEITDATNLTEKRRYPKLHAIIQEASRNDPRFDLTKVISLPDSETTAEEACETVAKFNDNNQKRDEGNDTEACRNQANQNSTIFHANHPCLRRSKLCKSMFKAWAHHFSTSGCHSHHVGKLQACAFELDDSGAQHVVQHKMFISPCDPENRWQQVTCSVLYNSHELSPSLSTIDNICQTIGDRLSDEEMLNLWICSERIWHDLEADPDFIDNLHISPTLSLEQILQQPPYKFRPSARVTMAYNLACTLLQTYSAEMQQREWAPGDIYFLYDPEDDSIHEPDFPYVASTFFSDRPSIDIKNKFPILIHFAKLLLEIGLGQLFVPKRLRLDVELTKWAQSDEANQSLVQNYVKAVMECLEAKRPRHIDDPRDEETQCRKVIFNLVSHLKRARDSFVALDPQRMQRISMLDSTLTEPTLEQVPTRQNALLCEDLSDLLPKNRMFDEQKVRFNNADTSHIKSAKAFLDLAENFYTSSMSGLTCSPDIRIAILDTGIRTSNAFIKGAKHNRSGEDSPIKASKSFVSQHPDDECGHGTNVASLILRIFPGANLYIAKIARDLEQDGVGQMVEAIEWARSFNVHIINMSFSIPKTSAVKRIIREAEKDGVIVFVAASNNGANTGRSFPATLDTVLCIHANDGKGNKGSMNPEPESNRDNLSTLGVAVPSVWENGVYLSGTSYATPVAAAIAAVILCFVEAAVAANRMPKESKGEAFDREGMKSILLSMTVLRDGYNCIVPWRRFLPPGAEADVLIANIQTALN